MGRKQKHVDDSANPLAGPHQTANAADSDIIMHDDSGESSPGQHSATPLQSAAEPGVVSHKEDKRTRFRRLANRRVPRVIKCLEAVARLANRSNYDYTDEQRTKLLDMIGQAYQSLRLAYDKSPKPTAAKLDLF